MGKPLIDLTGMQFGRLTVLKRVEKPLGSKETGAFWLCKCSCGHDIVVYGNKLRSGHTKSCGCYRRDTSIIVDTKHGMKNTRLYRVWKHMKARCLNPNDKRYKDYGGRGIQICDDWKNDFASFYKWAVSNGYNNNLSIERIDVNGNYCPENCKWIKMAEQAWNKRNSYKLTLNGETHCISEWAQITGIPVTTLTARIKENGWDVEKALTTPINVKGHYRKVNSRYVTYNGETHTVTEWASILGINAGTIFNRLNRGCTAEKALSKVK